MEEARAASLAKVKNK
jgi:hypothetical protein